MPERGHNRSTYISLKGQDCILNGLGCEGVVQTFLPPCIIILKLAYARKFAG